MIFKTSSVVLLVTALCVQGAKVHAGFLFEGETIGYQYLFPNTSTVFYDAGPVLVGPSVEFSTGLSGSIRGFDIATVDVSDTNILVDFFAGGPGTHFTSPAFNGFRIFDRDGTLPAFTSVTVNSTTNMAGFSSSNVTFDADNIYVNWRGLFFNPDTIVSIDVNPSPAAVPEPGTMTLAGLGIVGLIGSRWRKRRMRG